MNCLQSPALAPSRAFAWFRVPALLRTAVLCAAALALACEAAPGGEAGRADANADGANSTGTESGPMGRFPTAISRLPMPGQNTGAPAAADDEVPVGFRRLDQVMPAGGVFEVELLQGIDLSTARPGDPVTASVTRPMVENHRIMLEVNSLLRGVVTLVGAAPGGGVRLGVRFETVFFDGNEWPLTASIVTADPLRLPGLPMSSVPTILGGVLAGAESATAGGAEATAGGTVFVVPAGWSRMVEADGPGAVPFSAGWILRVRLDEPLHYTVFDPAAY
ncbi:MAG: hypothetical protein J4G03_07350 [Gemmatimonadetes bacterium]|nr:hypothetical protein [Gemmatimonadota bacterium]